MKKLIWGMLTAAMISIFPFNLSRADTSTTRFGLTKPDVGSTNWGPKINTNYDIIDNAAGLSISNTFTSSNTFNGATSFQAQMSLANGSAASPTLSWTNASSSGFFLSGTSLIGISIAGISIFEIGTTSVTAKQNFFGTGTGQFSGTLSAAGGSFTAGVSFTSATFSGQVVASSGTTLFTIKSDGVAIGTTTPQAMLTVGSVLDAGTNPTILAARAYTGSSNPHVFEDISTVASAAGTSAASYDSRLKTIGTNNYGHIIGYQSGIIHDSDGTIDHLYDFGAFAFNNGGAATNRYGFYAGNTTGTGTLGNQYGVYIESLTKGSTNYGVFTAGTMPSAFGGQIRGPNGTSGVKLLGTTTNDNASAGEYGEYKETLVSSAQNTGASATIFDATSILLSSGDYNLSGSIIYRRNGATFTSTDLEIGISTNSGNSAIGLVNNSNYFYNVGVAPTSFTFHSIQVPTYRVSLSASTTYYLKALVDVYTAGTPQYTAKISAIRIR